jgi:hypothetical protein
MKRLFTAIASALGFSVAAGTEPKTGDPKTVYFSLATINDALPTIDTTAKPSERDLVIHEDDWRQFEAVARSFEAEIKEEIAGVQRIFKEKSKPSGEYRIFTEIHVRKRIVRPLPTPLGWNWSECGRAASVGNADALGRPRRSVSAFGLLRRR